MEQEIFENIKEIIKEYVIEIAEFYKRDDLKEQALVQSEIGYEQLFRYALQKTLHIRSCRISNLNCTEDEKQYATRCLANLIRKKHLYVNFIQQRNKVCRIAFDMFNKIMLEVLVDAQGTSIIKAEGDKSNG